MSRIIALVREKNSLKYLQRLTKQLMSIADMTIILDDHSTDGSYEWLRAYATATTNFLVVRQPVMDYNGGRDWNVLHDLAGKYSPDWIFCIDADELVEESCIDDIRKLVSQSGSDILGWSFPFYYLWNSEHTYRNTGKYHNTKVIRLYRYDPERRPPNRPSHSTGVPDELDRRLIYVATTRILHYGYMDKADRVAKYKFYTERDADPMAAGSGGKDYEHLIEENPDVVEMVSVEAWTSSYGRSGNFLLRAPGRIVVGSTFPTADSFEKSMELRSFPPNALDEVRLYYVLDEQSIPFAKETIETAVRVLRPGGRIEVITTDYVGLCAEFQSERIARDLLEPRFTSTPTRNPINTIWYENKLAPLLLEAGLENVQRVPVVTSPVRLQLIGFKPGENQWH